jgi:hypothetical protein
MTSDAWISSVHVEAIKFKIASSGKLDIAFWPNHKAIIFFDFERILNSTWLQLLGQSVDLYYGFITSFCDM